MADEKDRKPKVELKLEVGAGGEGDAAASGPSPQGSAPRDGRAQGDGPDAPAGAGPAGAGDGASVGDAVRGGASAAAAWVARTFPGHENAFWGGLCGLVAAIAFLVIGWWSTLVIVVLVTVGVAAGQVLDGDARIVNALRRLFSHNQ